MSEQVVIESRFKGPPDSANGGYACGVLARRIAGSAEVTLRRPPPLDRPLSVDRDQEGFVLRDGDNLLAQGRPSGLELELPDPVGFDEADQAVERSPAFADHPFKCCFGCGPDRPPRDGLRIFPGQVGPSLMAATWVPDDTLPLERGAIAPEIVWAALDCPTGFGALLGSGAGPSVLVRLTGRVERPIAVGERLVALAWPRGGDRRKREGGCALVDERGDVAAVSTGLWIELR